MKKVGIIVCIILAIAFLGALVPDESASNESAGNTTVVENEEQENVESESTEKATQHSSEKVQVEERTDINDIESKVETTNENKSEKGEDKSTTNSSQTTQQSSKASESTESVIVPTQEDTTGHLVWVPVNGGTKYHTRESCSNMKNPKQVTKEHAEANGYTSCKRCH